MGLKRIEHIYHINLLLNITDPKVGLLESHKITSEDYWTLLIILSHVCLIFKRLRGAVLSTGTALPYLIY
jgi:hypothetical protein